MTPAPGDPAPAPGGASGEETALGFLDGGWRYKAILVAIALVVGLLSFFPLGSFASSTDTYAGSIQVLDDKKDTVMGLVAASTAASAAVSLLPGDAGTPIAEKLVDLSSDFLIVLTAIYLEKYLLTVLGFAAFKILVPLGCIAFIAAVLVRRSFPMKKVLVGMSAKLALFGVAIAVVVPASLWVSGMIEATYQASIDETIATAQQTTAQIEAEQQAQEQVQASEQGEGEGDGGGSVLDIFVKPVSDIVDNVTTSAADAVESAQNALNGFVEALAVMIVTSCIIPLLVLVFALWLVKVLLGVNIEVPMQALRPRALRGLGLGRR